nr:unnamed protein product [Callosobruchus chinensis]
MSPNGHALTPEESLRINSRETVWPSAGKETIIRKASSVAEKKLTDDKRNTEEDLKKPIVLPDVLPVNVKLLGPRSQQYTRPTHLSLSPLDPGETKRSPKSPPSSPPKSPSRNSPFAPLRTISMSPLDPHGENKTRSGSVQSNHCETSSPTSPPKSPSRNSPFAPLRTISLSTATTITTSSSPKFSISAANKRTPPPLPNSSPPGSPKGQSSPKNRTPPSPRKSSPPLIKPSLSPNASVKLSSVRQASSTTNTPLHASPLASPESPKCGMLTKKLEDYPKVEEGLQMIQRTEVVLRVNTTTTDAASQTEAEELSPPEPMPLPIRKKFQEEIECEKLAEDFIDHLPHSDRLKEILGLFRVDITTKPRPNNSPFRSRNNTPSSSPPPTISSVSLCTTTSTSTTTRLSISPPILSTSIPSVVPMVEPTSPLSGSSSYFTTSEPKAKFLTRYSQDMNKCYVVKNTKDLSQKKEELVNRLDKKLEVLRGEQVVVTDECKINDELGENVESHINRLARPHEVAKFRLHVEEVGKITSLLLGLSGRLARAENALIDMAEEHPERRILEAKRDKLLEQLEEAKKLKESIDRRSVSVSNILNKYLNSDEYADYDHFINMKAKLIMDSKEISDKIKLGEEQLVALKETLIVTD